MSFVPLMFAFGSALWVYEDAAKRNWTGDRVANRPWKWAVGVFLLWIVFTPLYLIRRRKHPVLA